MTDGTAAILATRAKADIDRLATIAGAVETARQAERQRAIEIACRRRYWPVGRWIAKAIEKGAEP